MPMFRAGSWAEPQEVAVAIGADGSTAHVMLPDNVSIDMEIRDMDLSTALHIACALARGLDTKVCVIDEGNHIHLIDDEPSALILS